MHDYTAAAMMHRLDKEKKSAAAYIGQIPRPQDFT